MPGALNWRLWLAVGFLVLLPILYVKGRTDGRKLERASVVAAQAQADNEARKIEQRRQDRVGEAAGLAAARAARLAADADRARAAADSLRAPSMPSSEPPRVPAMPPVSQSQPSEPY
jgi:hypothetical protein